VLLLSVQTLRSASCVMDDPLLSAAAPANLVGNQLRRRSERTAAPRSAVDDPNVFTPA